MTGLDMLHSLPSKAIYIIGSLMPDWLSQNMSQLTNDKYSNTMTVVMIERVYDENSLILKEKSEKNIRNKGKFMFINKKLYRQIR